MKTLFSIQAMLFTIMIFENCFHELQSLEKECCANGFGNVTSVLNSICIHAKSYGDLGENNDTIINAILKIGDAIKKDNDEKATKINCKNLVFNNCFEWLDCLPNNYYCTKTGNIYHCP